MPFGEPPLRRRSSRRSSRTSTVEKVGDYWTAVVRPRDFDPKKKYPVIVDVYGGPKHLHVVAGDAELARAAVARRPGVHRRRDRQPRHAGPRPGLGAGRLPEVRHRAARRPGEGAAGAVRQVPGAGPRPRRHRRLVVRRVHGGERRAAPAGRVQGRGRRCARSPTGRTTTRTTPSATWACLPESKKAYDEACLIPLAKDLKRPLLLVHGTADDNVYFRHTLKLADALFRAGKDFEVLPLPGVTHMYTADPLVMERLWAQDRGVLQDAPGGAEVRWPRGE